MDRPSGFGVTPHLPTRRVVSAPEAGSNAILQVSQIQGIAGSGELLHGTGTSLVNRDRANLWVRSPTRGPNRPFCETRAHAPPPPQAIHQQSLTTIAALHFALSQKFAPAIHSGSHFFSGRDMGMLGRRRGGGVGDLNHKQIKTCAWTGALGGFR